MGGQKVKKFVEIFMVDARILYVLAIKISDFLDSKKIFMCHFKSSTCSTSIVITYLTSYRQKIVQK
jgi:hypothetical protein